jgi:RNA polymerase sigma-32 factor
MGSLNARERMIIVERKLRDDPRTLESLGQELGLSKERIRQLEAQALAKLRRRLETVSGSAAETLATAEAGRRPISA